MLSLRSLLLLLPLAAPLAQACEDSACYPRGLKKDVVLTRHVRRMQPDAQNATVSPKAPLEWGQLNFLHTTDTHGWLEGHIKEQNYGADWGDYVSFTKQMKRKALDYGVDLLLVDTGDLHDGAGLSDATPLNGEVSNPIFENVDYDLLTIGNHELYVTEIAYEHFYNFSRAYGDRYLTSNVDIINPATGNFTSIGSRYRYFTTPNGIRIMSYGVLFDFTGNSNVSHVTRARDMVRQPWFLSTLNYTEPIDLFLIIGHNPVRANVSSSTFGTLYNAIRNAHPNTPIQGFGGHTHIRDFAVYDSSATALESGRYCETLGWLSMNGLQSPDLTRGNDIPADVPQANRTAMRPSTGVTSLTNSTHPTNSTLRYARRYLDWNRLTFAYHANNSQSVAAFDTPKGLSVTDQIFTNRTALNLTSLYGCAPATYCQYCRPFGDPGNIFTLLSTALSTVVVNESRADTPRLIIINTGSIRFDLVEGPFTYDDSFIVSPFTDAFQFIPDVPYEAASQVLGILNAGPYQKKKRSLSSADFGFSPLTLLDERDTKCLDPPISHDHLHRRSYSGGRILRRQSTSANTPGYVTTDDFGRDGDDTPHRAIPNYPQPNDLQANASFPTNGSDPETVDLVFLDFIVDYVIDALASVGANYTESDVSYYLPKSFTTNSYLPAYAKIAWQDNVPNCPVGGGVGFTKR